MKNMLDVKIIVYYFNEKVECAFKAFVSFVYFWLKSLNCGVNTVSKAMIID